MGSTATEYAALAAGRRAKIAEYLYTQTHICLRQHAEFGTVMTVPSLARVYRVLDSKTVAHGDGIWMNFEYSEMGRFCLDIFRECVQPRLEAEGFHVSVDADVLGARVNYSPVTSK